MTVFVSTTWVSTFCCSLDLQGSLLLRLLPHPLDGVHDVALLVEEGVPEIRRPLDVVAEPLDDVGNRRHRLDARVPGLLGDRVGERLVLQVLVLREPLLELHDLQRVGGRHERLGQERVRVEGDRSHERIELVRRELRCRLCVRSGSCRSGRRRLLRQKRRVPRGEQRRAQDRHEPSRGQSRKARVSFLIFHDSPLRRRPPLST